MTTTFITFTVTRKQQIDHARNRLMTLRPYTHVLYGDSVQRRHPLELTDYVVYAALRGADYRKGDHTGGANATKALQEVIRQITYWGTSPAATGVSLRARWMPEGHAEKELFELKDALEAELAKWADAPIVEHPQHVPAKPIGNFLDAVRAECESVN